jgi:hypothetical protein
MTRPRPGANLERAAAEGSPEERPPEGNPRRYADGTAGTHGGLSGIRAGHVRDSHDGQSGTGAGACPGPVQRSQAGGSGRSSTNPSGRWIAIDREFYPAT